MQANGKTFTQEVSSGATLAGSALNLGGHTWRNVSLEVPSFTSGGTMYIHGAVGSDGNFHRVYVMDPADGAQNVLQISQASSVGGHYHLPQLSTFDYLKIELTSGITDSVTTFKWHVS